MSAERLLDLGITDGASFLGAKAADCAAEKTASQMDPIPIPTTTHLVVPICISSHAPGKLGR